MMFKRKLEDISPSKALDDRPRTRSHGPPPVYQTSPLVKKQRMTGNKQKFLKNGKNNSRVNDHDELNIIGDENDVETQVSSIKTTPQHLARSQVQQKDETISFRGGDSITTDLPSASAWVRCVTSPYRQSKDAEVASTQESQMAHDSGQRVQNIVEDLPACPSPSSSTSKQSKTVVEIPSFKKKIITPAKQAHEVRLPQTLCTEFAPCLQAQKLAVLRALQEPPLVIYQSSSYPTVMKQLQELAIGTIERHEGNSCLILGPRGSGKSRLIKDFLSSIPSASTKPPVVIRLSARCQTSNRLAMREIARQVRQQVGGNSSFGESITSEEEEEEDDINLLEPSYLPSIIGALPCLGRPVIAILDAFDSFASLPRQALLYHLLDTVQSCRGGSATVQGGEEMLSLMEDPAEEDSDVQADEVYKADGSNRPPTFKSEHGLLVIGVTSRVDCLTVLEKRVKSRFSHRVMRVGLPRNMDGFCNTLRAALKTKPVTILLDEWPNLWEYSIDKFLRDKKVNQILNEAFAFSKDLRTLFRLLIYPVVNLSPASPWLNDTLLETSVSTQRCPKQFPFLSDLSYAHMSLLVSATHSRTAGQELFNFEMLYDRFVSQVRMVASAPMQSERLGMGMMSVTRGVMFGAFEDLVSYQVFRPVGPPAAHITKEFVKYRCVPGREDLRSAVEQRGQTNLMKWFSRNQ